MGCRPGPGPQGTPPLGAFDLRGHLSNGFDFGSALVGGTRDARMLAACWQDMGLVQEFVERQAFLGSDSAVLAQMLGDAPYKEWCR